MCMQTPGFWPAASRRGLGIRNFLGRRGFDASTLGLSSNQCSLARGRDVGSLRWNLHSVEDSYSLVHSHRGRRGSAAAARRMGRCGGGFFRRRREGLKSLKSLRGLGKKRLSVRARPVQTPLFSGGDLLVAGLMYVWQLPHFYALVYMHQKDYAAAGYKMWGLPALGGVEKCLSLCMRYSYALAAAPFVSSRSCSPLTFSERARAEDETQFTLLCVSQVAAACGVTTTLFPLSSVPASAFVLCQLKRFTESPSRRNALRFFLHSLWYIMGMLFLAAWTMKPFDFKRRKEEDAAAVHSSLRCECPLGALKIFGQRGEGAPLGSLSNFSEHTNSYASAEGFVVGESGGCPRSFFPAAATVAAVNGQGDFRKGGLLRPYLSSLCMHRGLLSHANVCPWLRRERKRIEKHNPQHW